MGTWVVSSRNPRTKRRAQVRPTGAREVRLLRRLLCSHFQKFGPERHLVRFFSGVPSPDALRDCVGPSLLTKCFRRLGSMAGCIQEIYGVTQEWRLCSNLGAELNARA